MINNGAFLAVCAAAIAREHRPRPALKPGLLQRQRGVPLPCRTTQRTTQLLRLKTDIAITLVPLISRMVADPADRDTIVTDVAARWLALPTTTRAHYQALSQTEYGAIEHFGWDYLDIIEQGTPTGHNTAASPQDDAPQNDASSIDHEERAACQRWHQHLQYLRQRQTEYDADDIQRQIAENADGLAGLPQQPPGPHTI